jgi:hypothetical protein
MDRLKRALVIGINSYAHASQLRGCVADAEAMSKVLERDADLEPNYECRTLLDKMEDGSPITRAALYKACDELFTDARDDVLLFFSGHGMLTQFAGYLCAYDSDKNDWGVPMDLIMAMANASAAPHILIILDCCHAGEFANPSLLPANGQNPLALLRENMTVMAASLRSQASVELNGNGVFTKAVVNALQGGAADPMGWVTAPAIYAYVERRFGAFDQRPVYKSYATGVRVIRRCAPLIERFHLRSLIELFPTEDYLYQMDPEYEPEDEHGNVHEPVNKEKVGIAKLFKTYRNAGLLGPTIPDEQLYWTARLSHTAELTQRGREYWWLVKNKKL